MTCYPPPQLCTVVVDLLFVFPRNGFARCYSRQHSRGDPQAIRDLSVAEIAVLHAHCGAATPRHQTQQLAAEFGLPREAVRLWALQVFG